MNRKLITSLSRPVADSFRQYKNFGHKRQPTAGVTVLWHGFLTLTFIGMGLEWKRIAKFVLGDLYQEGNRENLELPAHSIQQK